MPARPSPSCRIAFAVAFAAALVAGCGRSGKPAAPATKTATPAVASALPPEQAALVGRWDIDPAQSVTHNIRMNGKEMGFDEFFAQQTGDQIPPPPSGPRANDAGVSYAALHSVLEIEVEQYDLRPDGTFRRRCKIDGHLRFDYEVTGRWRVEGKRVTCTSDKGGVFTLALQAGRLYSLENGNGIVYSKVSP